MALRDSIHCDINDRENNFSPEADLSQRVDIRRICDKMSLHESRHSSPAFHVCTCHMIAMIRGALRPGQLFFFSETFQRH